MRKFKWRPSDTEEVFNHNYINFPEQLQIYKDTPIEYLVNGRAFRHSVPNVENKKLKVDIFLGCSHTFGIGHYQENIWIEKVSKLTGNIQVNLGDPGRGIAKSYINLLEHRHLWDIQNVFHYQNIYARYDYITAKPIWSECMWSPVLDPGKNIHRVPWNEEYMKHTMTSKEYMRYHHNLHVNAIAGVCKKEGINYFHINTVPYNRYNLLNLGITFDNSKIPNIPVIESMPDMKSMRHITLARDGQHFTVQTHKIIGKLFLNKIKTHKEGYIENCLSDKSSTIEGLDMFNTKRERDRR